MAGMVWPATEHSIIDMGLTCARKRRTLDWKLKWRLTMGNLYRKKPVVIEAHQVPPNGSDYTEEMAVFIKSAHRDTEINKDGAY